MYLHIGSNIVIENKNIIGIFDIDKLTIQKTAREYLSLAEKNGQIENVSPYDIPKSFIVTNENNGQKIYISPLNVQTLLKRLSEKT